MTQGESHGVGVLETAQIIGWPPSQRQFKNQRGTQFACDRSKEKPPAGTRVPKEPRLGHRIDCPVSRLSASSNRAPRGSRAERGAVKKLKIGFVRQIACAGAPAPPRFTCCQQSSNFGQV